MQLLIVEDEKALRDGLSFNCEAEGYSVLAVESGEQALEFVGKQRFDALILDVMLPGIAGFEVVRRFREAGDFTPILILTALDSPEDVIKGFEAGADDYLAKPFELKVFLARLRALIRRSGWRAKSGQQISVINGRKINLDEYCIEGPEAMIKLTQMEARFLAYLMENPGRVITKEEVLQKVWGLRAETDTRAIDNFIVRLRRYLGDDPTEAKILRRIRGVGYRFDPLGQNAEPP
ncbi:MAG TPA: response regulator transcription factor [Pyrinomonadaceae bacterium]|nr:response regulator transcription factor [Pyrinomonadaceae bacterium]